jgi:probable addiction module antidote protein
MVKVAPYDSAEFLTTPEAISAYLDEVLETNDAALIAHAIGVIARASSMSEIARKSGLARESLYRALSGEGKTEFSTIVKVLAALNLHLKVEPIDKPRVKMPRKALTKPPQRKRMAMA